MLMPWEVYKLCTNKIILINSKILGEYTPEAKKIYIFFKTQSNYSSSVVKRGFKNNNYIFDTNQTLYTSIHRMTGVRV